jgi:hypothetical protein
LQRPVYLAQNRTAKYGYARVSTEDQNASLQRAALKSAAARRFLPTMDNPAPQQIGRSFRSVLKSSPMAIP